MDKGVLPGIKTVSILAILLCIIQFVNAQDDLADLVNKNAEPETKEYVSATFKGLRIINVQTIETAKKHNLQFNIQHRFGDVAGTGGGIHTLYGLDQAPDIRFSFDYGITDRLQVGIGHSKGFEPYKELVDGNLKFKLLRQTTSNSMPLSVTLYGVAGVSIQKSSTDTTSDYYFEDNFSHRLSYVTQAVIARKFTPGISFELLPTWVHRNFVSFDEPNDFFSLGAGLRAKFSKRFSFVADYYHNFNSYYSTEKDANGKTVYYDPLSVGVEIETGGHVFQLMFTNSTGILENLYLPFTKSNWADGGFRWGFNITRNFVLGGKRP